MIHSPFYSSLLTFLTIYLGRNLTCMYDV